MKTRFWLEMQQLQLYQGQNSCLKYTYADAETCAALFEFDLTMLRASPSSLSFIDLDPERSLWLELAISPHKILETADAELEELDF